MTRKEAINKGLYGSLHSFSDAQIRWEQRLSRGLNDGELRYAIAEEFGIEGGAAICGLWYSYKGGSNPRYILERWPDMPNDYKQVILQGRELLFSVRQLLSIPDHSQQLSLF